MEITGVVRDAARTAGLSAAAVARRGRPLHLPGEAGHPPADGQESVEVQSHGHKVATGGHAGPPSPRKRGRMEDQPPAGSRGWPALVVRVEGRCPCRPWRATPRRPPPPIPRSSGISASSRTSTTASRPWRTACCSPPAWSSRGT
ncbi:hypothetical protein ACFFX0_05105 [Citricoccus parietis]|uniref:Uncharacterized protein n=1 Tax=Citricoccus parietis TaxID=592307 RepID=A0ABV5FVA1_9MICC